MDAAGDIGGTRVITSEQVFEVEEVLQGRRLWTVVEGDCRDLFPLLPNDSVASVIADTPYSEHVHSKSRAGARVLHGGPSSVTSRANISRKADLGFDALTPDLRAACAVEFARVARRWTLAFSDVESVHLWERDLVAAGLDHVRVGAWVKLGGTPQFTGDRPGVGFEAIEIAHRTGRKRWNGGGHPGLWSHPIVHDRGAKTANSEPRTNETQKPLALLVELVGLFSDPGDLILDPTCGSATTGAASIRLKRRYIGCETRPEQVADARARLAAEEAGLVYGAVRAGQTSLFGVAS